MCLPWPGDQLCRSLDLRLDPPIGSGLELDAGAAEHLERLAASWGLLADVCFGDLLLFAPRPPSFVVVGQIRPTTSQTLYRDDLIGTGAGPERDLVTRAFTGGEIIEDELISPAVHEPIRVQCIPVRHDGAVVGVLARESAPWVGRQPGELERLYLEIFHRFARMITDGLFPFPEEPPLAEEVPRVSDGLLLLDETGRVEYASPNAMSNLHRVGIHVNTEGLRFAEFGLDDRIVRKAFSTARPVVDELEQGLERVLLVQAIPIIETGRVSGAVALVRDISELRRRDRLIVTKDATISEIHHRVKNNLQTISSLLRLQGRRLASPEAKDAIEESVRRIRSIAFVHETLSREEGDDVSFVEILRGLVRIVEETLTSPDRPVRFSVAGEAGRVPAGVATPLAVVLTELLQNAVDHAFPPEIGEGTVTVELTKEGERLRVVVLDDGVGLPEGFALDGSTGLGLTIVKTLVTTELGGHITMSGAAGSGTEVVLDVPLAGPLAG